VNKRMEERSDPHRTRPMNSLATKISSRSIGIPCAETIVARGRLPHTQGRIYNRNRTYRPIRNARLCQRGGSPYTDYLAWQTLFLRRGKLRNHMGLIHVKLTIRGQRYFLIDGSNSYGVGSANRSQIGGTSSNELGNRDSGTNVEQQRNGNGGRGNSQPRTVVLAY
jgi:hypothetical protein